jgi:hypothetical protein
MNAKKLIVALGVVAAAGSAFAADRTGEYVDFSNVQTSKTRAEVVAELNQARNQGYVVGGQEFTPVANVVSTRTRAEVRAEAIQAAKANKGTSSIYFGS